jgi:hypothetical protein
MVLSVAGEHPDVNLWPNVLAVFEPFSASPQTPAVGFGVTDEVQVD